MQQRILTSETATAARLTVTEYAVLGLLGHVGQPVSGYDLRKLIDSSVGYIWQPSKTQVYVVLGRLVNAGLATRRDVAQRERPDKQLYRITSAGRGVVRAWLGRDEPDADPDRSMLVLKLFFGRQGDRDTLVRQLRAFRDAYARRLAVYEADRDGTRRVGAIGDRYTALTLRYGIARARAAVEWADCALEELVT
jgi:DNA-binding PadR family transcriptional regulator